MGLKPRRISTKNKTLTFSATRLTKAPSLTTAVTSEDGVWVGGQSGGKGGLFFSRDGRTFKVQPGPSLWNTRGAGAGLLVTLDGELLWAGRYGIARSLANRTKWWGDKRQPPKVGEDILALHRDAEGTVWAGGKHEVWRSTDDGKRWKPVAKRGGPFTCFVDGPKGPMVLGTTCAQLHKDGLRGRRNLPGTVLAAAQSPDGTYLAVGESGLMLRSDDGGAWSRLSGLTKQNLNCVMWCGDRFLIGGDDRVLYASMDGRSLTRQPTPKPRVHFTAIVAFQDTVLLLGEGIQVVRGYEDPWAYTHESFVLSSAAPTPATEPVFDFRAFLVSPQSETAEQALDRYQRFLAAVESGGHVGDTARFQADYGVRIHTRRVSTGDLNKAQKRLGVQLPPSYRAFVVKHGLFAIGRHGEASLLKPSQLKPLADWMRKAGINPRKDLGLNERQVGFLNATIPFGDVDGKSFALFCFRTDAEGKECPVTTFDDHEMDWAARPVNLLGKVPASFDAHIRRLITEMVASIIEDVESGGYN